MQRPPKPEPKSRPRLSPEVLEAAMGSARPTMKLAAGEVVFIQGDPADAVFYIESGGVTLTVLSAQGKEGVIGVLRPGDFFGESCLAEQPLRLASAISTVASVLLRIDKVTMVRLLHEQLAFSEIFVDFLVTRNIQVEADLVDQLFNSSEKRLARLLLLLADFDREGESRTVPMVSQAVLAARVGTTRSRINYFMNKFRKLGLIEYNGTLKVHTALLDVIIRD